MKCLKRNRVLFYYANRQGEETELIDEYGNRTGQMSVEYTTPKLMYGNVSAAQGELQNRQFGDSETYDKVIVLDDRDTPINEYSILWIDTLPEIAVDGTTETPHDYIVKKVARSLNFVSIAISKVNVK